MSKSLLKALGSIELSEAAKVVFGYNGSKFAYPSSDSSDSGESYISKIIADNYSDDDPFFIFFEQDCMSPLLTLVRAESFESAYELFVETLTPLSDTDLADYVTGTDDNGNPEYASLTWTDNGFVTTELVQGFECYLVSVTF
jgi:hypothetical protein